MQTKDGHTISEGMAQKRGFAPPADVPFALSRGSFRSGPSFIALSPFFFVNPALILKAILEMALRFHKSFAIIPIKQETKEADAIKYRKDEIKMI